LRVFVFSSRPLKASSHSFHLQIKKEEIANHPINPRVIQKNKISSIPLFTTTGMWYINNAYFRFLRFFVILPDFDRTILYLLTFRGKTDILILLWLPYANYIFKE